MKLFFIFLLSPAISLASILHPLSDYNWRPEEGESFFKSETEYTDASTTMIIPAVITNDIDILEIAESFSVAVGLSDRLYFAMKGSYTAAEKSEDMNGKVIKRGAKTPNFSFNYLIQEEYPAPIEINFTLGMGLKVGDAIEEVNASGDPTGGNKMNGGSNLFGALAFIKSYDVMELRFDCVWKHDFKGETLVKAPSSSTRKSNSSADLVMLIFGTRFSTWDEQSFHLGLLTLYSGKKSSTDTSNIKTSIDSAWGHGISSSYSWLFDQNFLINLGFTYVKQSNYSMQQGTTNISIQDTTSLTGFLEMSLAF